MFVQLIKFVVQRPVFQKTMAVAAMLGVTVFAVFVIFVVALSPQSARNIYKR